MKRILDYNPMTGLTTYFDYDHSTDTTIVGMEQDVTQIIERNKLLQNDPDYWKQGVKDCWAHYASYPAIIIEKWIREYGVNVFDKNHEKRVKELTNRPEYRYLKTTTKMV